MRGFNRCGIIKRLTGALCLVFLLFAAVPAQAGDQTTIASNFLKFLGSDKKIISEEIVKRNLLDPALAQVPVAHLFQLAGGGYMLVSTDRSISPVKAYSLAGDFAALPEPYRKALLDELELRVRVAALPAVGRAPQTAGTTETEARRDFLLNFAAARQPLAVYTPGSYLITAHWNQDYPYNKFLPLAASGGKNVLAGCVNVAAGQIMRFYKYPVAGKGVLSYTWEDKSTSPATLTPLKAVLYRNYDWANMPDKLDAATPEYQADEVALFMRDLGIANHTNFGITDSSASFSPDSLVENFGYSTALAMKDNMTDYSGFLATLKGDLDAGRPLLLGLPNHMVVADGYSADNSGRKVHLNMGWGGSVDDFYFLDPPPDGNIPNFDTSAGKLSIHYNIKPCTSDSDCYVNLETGDSASSLVITGNFDREKDKDDYEFYLKGETSFSATRGGYSNIAFFVSFINEADGSTAFALADPFAEGSANKTIAVGNLTAGKYRLRVSLCDAGGLWCSPLQNNFNYTVTLTSQTLSAEEQALADQALRKPPVINSILPDVILDAGLSAAKKILIDARDENGDPVALSVDNSNPLAVRAVLNGNILELTPTGTAKIASRIVVTASAGGQNVQKSFLVMTDNGQTLFGKSFTVGGTFASKDDVQSIPAILEGDCQIQGDNGYVSQAFFSSVVDSSGAVIGSIDGVLGTGDKMGSVISLQSLNRGIYSLKAAPCGTSSCYVYDPPPAVGWAFKLSVTCPAAEATPITVAGLLGIDLAGAYWPIIKPGDLNGDEAVNLADAVLALQLLSRMDTTGKTIYLQADVDQTTTIDTADVIFILQKVAALR